jgi:hypothetical protein
MSQLEERALRRWSGRTIMLRSLMLGGAGVAPLMLYIMFGPSDGNPIGLGLLAVATVPFALCGLGIGLIKFLVEALSPGR